MPWWKFLIRKRGPALEVPQTDRGFLVFESTSEVIQAEKLLKAQGWPVRVMGPPPELRQGCDLVIEFPLLAELEITRELRDAGLEPLQAVPVTGPLLKPVDLFQVKDFGEHLMVRAANMKLTVSKASCVIVNVSGGGCPDVPYLALSLVGRRLEEAPRPRDFGHTLCGYALELAFQEMERRCSQS
jgi:hypothetical protein